MQRVVSNANEIGLWDQHNAPQREGDAMKVHAIVWLLGDSGDVSNPEGRDDQQEKSNEEVVAILN